MEVLYGNHQYRVRVTDTLVERKLLTICGPFLDYVKNMPDFFETVRRRTRAVAKTMLSKPIPVIIKEVDASGIQPLSSLSVITERLAMTTEVKPLIPTGAIV